MGDHAKKHNAEVSEKAGGLTSTQNALLAFLILVFGLVVAFSNGGKAIPFLPLQKKYWP